MSLRPEEGEQDEDVYASAEADEIAMPPAAAKKKKRKAPPAEPVEVGSLWISIGQNKRFKYFIWLTVLLSMLLMCVDSPHTGPAFSTAYDSDGFRYVLDHEVYTADGTRYGYRDYPGSDARGSSAFVSTEADWISDSGPGLWRPDLLNSLELLSQLSTASRQWCLYCPKAGEATSGTSGTPRSSSSSWPAGLRS